MSGQADDTTQLAYGTVQARWVLFATVLGSALAFIDATVVNVALPTIGEDLDSGLGGLAWTVNAYTLSLASLILLGGSLGDRFGRRRIFQIGVAWFAVASLLCGIAPNIETLVVARVLQGIGGALLTPGSLAILQASFRQQDRSRAIGAWSGLAGIAGAAGPFLGGWLIQAASWRWVFLINLPVAVLVMVVTRNHVPESRDVTAAGKVDVSGAILGAVALGSITYALITWQSAGLDAPEVIAGWLIGIFAAIGFVVRERMAKDPMLPLTVFASPVFRATNLVTFAVYAALGGVFFWLVLTLQVVVGFDPLQAGIALLPITVILLLLSARIGALSERIGPRTPMTVGPLLASLGVAWMSQIGAESSYWIDILPPVSLFGLGLAFTVAPLTATVLAAAPNQHAGLASGVNNAVARVAGLLAVAVLPLVVGLSGEDYTVPALLDPAFTTAMSVCAALLAVGSLLALLFVPGKGSRTKERVEAEPIWSCGVDGPPLERCPHDGALASDGRARTG